LQKKDTLTAAN